MKNVLSRRDLLQGAALSAGAVALIRAGLTPTPARAQGSLPAGTVHSFAKAGVRFHTYVSPAQAVNVTAHVIELGDQLLVVDSTFLPPTAMELADVIASTGKPVHTAYVSHEHPDHWGGVSTLGDLNFVTLPEIREGLRAEATNGENPEPTSLLNGADLALGMTEIGGVAVEFRAYDNAEAPKAIVAVLPEQKVAVVQDLVYNGVYFAPGVDRKNWIATLESFRDDPAFETLLVGHGLPTTRGELDSAIAYLKTFDAAWDAGATPDDVKAAMMTAYPSYDGAFLLGLIEPYWDK
ncbi:MBL fold metallo-hydrolase [Thalassococcus lentus]|uniref:MBL fold metallo-hydrolase n=1 Tax=Thalassococcus lentus TaxID=1210524 RepID=A0ABT4XUP5_9RHOB|nr:MBL fold metallo-hydrolase [Thalassococcus lentus]MDA7425692.1 MBL fold metallo-hydrolase [Thalassococcus lentus]